MLLVIYASVSVNVYELLHYVVLDVELDEIVGFTWLCCKEFF